MTASMLSGLVLVGLFSVLLVIPTTTVPRGRDSLPASPVMSRLESRAVVLSPDSLAPLVNHDPFRLNRSPAAVPYNSLDTVANVALPPPVRPQFILTGILWGAQPTAVMEGIPGTDGPRLVRPGDVMNGFRVVRITRDGLTIRGADTTWNLAIREPWR